MPHFAAVNPFSHGIRAVSGEYMILPPWIFPQVRLTHLNAFPRLFGRDDGLSASPRLALLTKIVSRIHDCFVDFVLLGCLLASAVVPAIGTPVPSLQIPKVTRPPKISDFLEGKAREAEMVVTEFR